MITHRDEDEDDENEKLIMMMNAFITMPRYNIIISCGIEAKQSYSIVADT